MEKKYLIVGTYKETGKRRVISKEYYTKEEAERVVKAVFQTHRFKKIYKYVKVAESEYGRKHFSSAFDRF